MTYKTKELPQNYDHASAEKKWQDHWYATNLYHWDESASREQTYVIDTPPPTVSGLLHMGHVFSYTQCDFIARFQRMSGKTVFYPMGFDDNGLPTERLVEKIIKKRAVDMTREAFIAECDKVAEEARGDFRTLFKSIALSVDWRQEYHTISDESRKISQMSFLDLHHKGHAYRKLQPMLWDPVDQTAIAQAEVEDKELDSSFNDIWFEVEPSPSGRGQGEGKAHAPELLIERARELRKNTTDAEQLFWNILRDRQFENLKFRRQHPIEPYVVDFFCHEQNLIIELDGGQHASDEGREKDTKRTAFLDSKGYRVLRYWNNDVLGNLEGVLTHLMNALTPTLSQGERERILIGTTRPELIPACVGIFYHPEDTRYQHLKGKFAITPLFGVRVPILEDESVEMEKGTGIMMCCTFGDEKDIEKWRKHDLPIRMVLNKYGKLDFGALDCFPESATPALDAIKNKKTSNKDPKHKGARETILELLAEAGLLKESRPIKHMVKCAERSGAPLEILPTPQWFVAVTDKKEALKAKSKECVWHPEWMQLRMEQWIDGLNWDWCISRQRYFGVPFPVWYSKRAGEEGKVLVAAPDQLPVNPLVDLPRGYTREEVEADADVMDTWATSSISPQISSKGITKELAIDATRHAQLFPADMRPQAHEIIRTWAFYTLAKAHLHENTIPWKNLMISGWCLAEDKTKMSKSKGNVVTPVELIQERGTDAVRYWAATSRLGVDTAFSPDLLKIGKKLVGKLWNATKFAAIHLDKLDGAPVSAAADVKEGKITEALDLWVLTRLGRAVEKATEAFHAYEYADALRATEDFFWNDFCDNYLELVKARVYDEKGVNKPAQMSAVHTIYHCLDGILRLYAPVMPHITEELFSHIFPVAYDSKKSIHARGTWPNAANYPRDEKAESSGIAGVALLNAIRKAKSERNVSIKYPIEAIFLAPHEGAENAGTWELIKPVVEDVKAAGSVAQLNWTEFHLLPTADIETRANTDDGRYTLLIAFAPEADNKEVA